MPAEPSTKKASGAVPQPNIQDVFLNFVRRERLTGRLGSGREARLR